MTRVASPFDDIEELTDNHKKFIDENYLKMDLMAMIRQMSGDPKLDGRCKFGRLTREYMASKGYQYKTSKIKKRDEINFTVDQKEFIANNAGKMKPLEITRLLFNNPSLHQFGKESLAVQSAIKEINPNLLGGDEYTDEKYVPPKTQLKALKKVNEALGIGLEINKLSVREQKNLDQLLLFLHSPRYLQIVNSLKNIEERQLYEKEYIREVWEKPDLNASELNLCISLVNEYIQQIRVQRMIAVYQKHIEESYEDKVAASMPIASTMKSLYDEYNASVKRQKDYANGLSGARKDRIDQKIRINKSMVALVEAFRDEEERKNMLKLAELRKKLVKDEINRLESLPEWETRIFGIDPEEVLE